jgi:hypothetical protein
LNSSENDDPKKQSYIPTYDPKRKFYFLAVAVQEDARATRSLLLRPVAVNGKRLQQSRANSGI